MERLGDEFDNLSESDREMMETNLWYLKAREKIESFLSGIDPGLEVDIQESIVTPDDKKAKEYEAVTLIFTHKTNPNLRWTMEIKKDDKYIEDELEGVVRKIYNKEISE